MKTRSIAIILAIALGVIALGVSTAEYDRIYKQNCEAEGGFLSGPFSCTQVFSDFATPPQNLTDSEIESILASLQNRENALNLLMQMYQDDKKPFMQVFIVGLNQTYIKGDKITFTAIEAGVDDNLCTAPNYLITNTDTNVVHANWTDLHRCLPPFEKKFYPILHYNRKPSYGWDIPPITEAGNYTLQVKSKFDSFAEKKFRVIDSDYVFERKVVYTIFDDNLSSQKVTIDLDTGEIESKTIHGIFNNKLAKNRLDELNSIIKQNKIIGTIPTFYGSDEKSHVRIDLFIGDIKVNSISWQHEYMRDSPIDVPMDESYVEFFEYVEKIAQENGIPKGGPLVR